MSIASAITNAQQKVANAYTAVNSKGGTLPATQDLSNLPTAINSISTGGTIDSLNITPSTSAQQITASGGVDGYSPINVSAVTSSIDSNIQPENIKKNVTILGVTGTLEGGGIGITREVSSNGVYQIPYSSFTFNLPSTATDVGSYAMYYAFKSCSGLTSVDLSSLTTVSGSNAMYYAFNYCTNLTSVDLSNLTTVNGSSAMYYAFTDCSNLTSLDLSSLTTVSGNDAMNNAFTRCLGLTSLDLSNLTSVINGSSSMQNAFTACGNLTSVDLSSLTTVSGSNAVQSMFNNCQKLTGPLDLSSLTTVNGSGAMQAMFNYCTKLTSVDLSNLTTVNGSSAMQSMFINCSGLTSVDLSSLQRIGTNSSATNYGQFSGFLKNCSNLTTLTFPDLETIYCTGGTTTSYGTFADNNKIQKMYFPKLDTITYGTGASTTNQNACKNVFYGCSSLTELHFAAANQSAIEASPGYSTAWGRGAGNVTIYFDL